MSGGYLATSAIQQITDILEGQQFFLRKPDVEFGFYGYDQVDVRKGIPAIYVISRHLGSNFDIVIVKHFTKNLVQSFQ